MFCVGATQESVALPVATCVTEMENAARAVLVLPSLTLIVTPEKAPTSPAAGVPDSLPVDVLKVAHAGLFAMVKVKASPSASVVTGENAYVEPTAMDVAGLPLMVGALLAAAVTVRVKAGREAVTVPSLTLMTIPEWTAAVVGVPESRPVVVLKLAQLGLLAMENPRVLPSASLAVGWKV